MAEVDVELAISMFMAIPVTLNHSNDMQAAHSFGTLVNCV
jgi:hypothetical protein